MKRSSLRFPLMAATAMAMMLSLTACDDKKQDETAAVPAAVEEQTAATVPAPETTTADTSVAVETPAPATMSASAATAFATAEGATTGAVFLTLTNSSEGADKLVAAVTSKAASVEVHESTVDAATGTMSMRKVETLDIPAGQSAMLAPGGFHIMLIGLTAPLTLGETFDITLDFDQAADVTIPVTVVAPGATASDATAAHEGHVAAPAGEAGVETETHDAHDNADAPTE